jgi:hypothetical protein
MADKKILIIEDNLLNLELAQELLELPELSGASVPYLF